MPRVQDQRGPVAGAQAMTKETREDLIGHIEDAAYDGITDVAVSHVHKLFDELDKLRAERDEARARCRDAAQVLIGSTGADGPADVGDAARRAVVRLAVVERERDEARARCEMLRVACDGCADSEAKTGAAHYHDCPVAVLQAERDEARAEVEMLRGVGCREQKPDEPESGPCGACLRCAEERGAEWAIRAKAQVVYALVGDAAYSLLAREVCNKAREKR